MANKKKDPVEAAIDQTEQDKSSKTRGPRDRYYFVAAVGEITELQKNDDGEEEEIIRDGVVHGVYKSTSEKEAAQQFKAEFDIDPEIIENGEGIEGGGNGFYLAMGTGMSSVQRLSVTTTPEQLMRRTTKSIRATLHIDGHDHPLFGNGLRGLETKINGEVVKFKDNDLFAVEFEDLVVEGKKIPKPKLKKREVVRASDLKNIETI